MAKGIQAEVDLREKIEAIVDLALSLGLLRSLEPKD